MVLATGQNEDRGRCAAQDHLMGRRVLVVEDEALVAMMMEDELADAGATVVGPVATVASALELIDAALADGGLDGAVLDVNLLGEVVTPVADALAAHGVPFLFATGYEAGCDTGGHDGMPILFKPFGAHEVAATLARITGSGRDGTGRLG